MTFFAWVLFWQLHTVLVHIAVKIVVLFTGAMRNQVSRVAVNSAVPVPRQQSGREDKQRTKLYANSTRVFVMLRSRSSIVRPGRVSI